MLEGDVPVAIMRKRITIFGELETQKLLKLGCLVELQEHASEPVKLQVGNAL